MQYHGIASYKFEYQLSTGGDWTTAVDTPNTSTSYAYTIEGLTGGKGYNLRAIVTDRAGNSSTGTNTANTKKPEKNPGGVITDNTNDYVIGTTPTQPLINTLVGKTVLVPQNQRTVTYTTNLTGETAQYVPPSMSTWYVMAEDQLHYYLFCKRWKPHLDGGTWILSAV